MRCLASIVPSGMHVRTIATLANYQQIFYGRARSGMVMRWSALPREGTKGKNRGYACNARPSWAMVCVFDAVSGGVAMRAL